MPSFNFCDGGYRLESPNSECSRTINHYTEIVEKGPRAGKKRLLQVPGMTEAYSLAESPIRGLWTERSNNRMFVVAGERLYELFDDGTPPSLQGNVGNDGKLVQMVSNGFQLLIASAGRLYINSAPGVVTALDYDSSTDPVNGRTIAFMDNYFISALVNSKDVVISDLAPAGGTWYASDIARKEGYADNIAGIIAVSPYLWVHGVETSEIWATSTNEFPFDRVQGGFLPVGCTATDSIAGGEGVHLWLWDDEVWMASGTQYRRVSTAAVENAIRGYTDKELAEGFFWKLGKHLFYVLSFPHNDRTWVYDVSTDDWAEWLYCPNPNSNAFSRYRGRTYAKCWDKHFVGDYETGQIFQLREDVFTDANGVPLVRERTAPYIADENRNLTFGKLIFDVDTGIGLDVALGDPGYDPQIMMWSSKNRGKTFSQERRESLGRIGQHNKLVEFRQMGSSMLGMAVRSRVTDPVRVIYNDVYFDKVS